MEGGDSPTEELRQDGTTKGSEQRRVIKQRFRRKDPLCGAGQTGVSRAWKYRGGRGACYGTPGTQSRDGEPADSDRSEVAHAYTR